MLQLDIDFPTINVSVDEVWPDGDAPDDITAEAVIEKVKLDGVDEFFFWSEGEVIATIVTRSERGV
jgi:hypothetical protein